KQDDLIVDQGHYAVVGPAGGGRGQGRGEGRDGQGGAKGFNAKESCLAHRHSRFSARGRLRPPRCRGPSRPGGPDGHVSWYWISAWQAPPRGPDPRVRAVARGWAGPRERRRGLASPWSRR